MKLGDRVSLTTFNQWAWALERKLEFFQLTPIDVTVAYSTWRKNLFLSVTLLGFGFELDVYFGDAS